VTGAAQHHIHRITFSTFQVISAKQPVGLEMPDHGLDGLPTLQCTPQSLCFDAALLARDEDCCRILTMPAVTAIDERLVNCTARQSTHLHQCIHQGMTVKRVTGQGHPTHDEVALVGCRDTCLNTKLIAFVGLAFADTFHLRCMQAVQPVSPIRRRKRDRLLGSIGI